MKKLLFLFSFLLLTSFVNKHPQKGTVYKVIIETETIPGDIDSVAVAKLPPHLKALAAFYAAMGGTNCSNDECSLTTALGLGKQGSEQHKRLITKYFPADKVAETVVAQDCYLRPGGASSFSDFKYLSIVDLGNTVRVEYELFMYDHGKERTTKGPDTYKFSGNKFLKIKRGIWKEIDSK